MRSPAGFDGATVRPAYCGSHPHAYTQSVILLSSSLGLLSCRRADPARAAQAARIGRLWPIAEVLNYASDRMHAAHFM